MRYMQELKFVRSTRWRALWAFYSAILCSYLAALTKGCEAAGESGIAPSEFWAMGTFVLTLMSTLSILAFAFVMLKNHGKLGRAVDGITNVAQSVGNSIQSVENSMQVVAGSSARVGACADQLNHTAQFARNKANDLVSAGSSMAGFMKKTAFFSAVALAAQQVALILLGAYNKKHAYRLGRKLKPEGLSNPATNKVLDALAVACLIPVACGAGAVAAVKTWSAVRNYASIAKAALSLVDLCEVVTSKQTVSYFTDAINAVNDKIERLVKAVQSQDWVPSEDDYYVLLDQSALEIAESKNMHHMSDLWVCKCCTGEKSIYTSVNEHLRDNSMSENEYCISSMGAPSAEIDAEFCLARCPHPRCVAQRLHDGSNCVHEKHDDFRWFRRAIVSSKYRAVDDLMFIRKYRRDVPVSFMSGVCQEPLNAATWGIFGPGDYDLWTRYATLVDPDERALQNTVTSIGAEIRKHPGWVLAALVVFATALIMFLRREKVVEKPPRVVATEADDFRVYFAGVEQSPVFEFDSIYSQFCMDFTDEDGTYIETKLIGVFCTRDVSARELNLGNCIVVELLWETVGGAVAHDLSQFNIDRSGRMLPYPLSRYQTEQVIAVMHAWADGKVDHLTTKPKLLFKESLPKSDEANMLARASCRYELSRRYADCAVEGFSWADVEDDADEMIQFAAFDDEERRARRRSAFVPSSYDGGMQGADRQREFPYYDVAMRKRDREDAERAFLDSKMFKYRFESVGPNDVSKSRVLASMLKGGKRTTDLTAFKLACVEAGIEVVTGVDGSLRVKNERKSTSSPRGALRPLITCTNCGEKNHLSGQCRYQSPLLSVANVEQVPHSTASVTGKKVPVHVRIEQKLPRVEAVAPATPSSDVIKCTYCKKKGADHVIANCPKLARKNARKAVVVAATPVPQREAVMYHNSFPVGRVAPSVGWITCGDSSSGMQMCCTAMWGGYVFCQHLFDGVAKEAPITVSIGGRVGTVVKGREVIKFIGYDLAFVNHDQVRGLNSAGALEILPCKSLPFAECKDGESIMLLSYSSALEYSNGEYKTSISTPVLQSFDPKGLNRLAFAKYDSTNGNCGAPIINSNGRVVGIHHGTSGVAGLGQAFIVLNPANRDYATGVKSPVFQ